MFLALLYSYVFNIDGIRLYLSVFLSSVNGAKSFKFSKLSAVNLSASLSLTSTYVKVSFKPKEAILLLIALIVLL